MSQHDLSIANQGFPAFRSDLNDALQALGSMQSGTSAPATTYANMLWYDTTNNIVKMRNEDNDAWISLITLDQTNDIVAAVAATLATFVTLSVTGNATLGDSSSDTLTVNAKTTFGSEISAPNTFGFKNRIINGAMMIDQRNAGASVTPDGSYTLDRWQYLNSQTSKVTIQQNAASVSLPTGFTNYLGVTSSSAYSSTSTDYFFLTQAVEGFNVSDLGWGTASAQTVTLSFQVRSSLTGTFSGAFTNSAGNRTYPFSYSIPAANTWTTISVTVAGDTTGTWLTNNGIGIRVKFNLGSGSTRLGAVGTWSGSVYDGVTSSVSVVGTSGATFYITGVQLEKGSTATSFDYRPYSTELALCQRYCQKTYNTNVAIGTVTDDGAAISRASASSNAYFVELQRPTQVAMRATPTVVTYSSATGALGQIRVNSSDVLVYSINNQGMNFFGYPYIASAPAAGADCRCHYLATAEL